jgi:transposase
MNAKTKKRSKVKQAKKKLKKLNRKNASSAVRTRKPYSSDMSKAAWERLKPHIPTTKIGGRPRSVCIKEVINAMLYVLHTGCPWRSLPHDFPTWSTVYDYFRKWSKNGVFLKINSVLTVGYRKHAGREGYPSAAIIDSQSVKTNSFVGGEIGYDGGKKIKGRKRFILTDTMGLVLVAMVCSAGLSEKAGAMQMLQRIKQTSPLAQICNRIKLVWADGGYQGNELAQFVLELWNWIWTIVKRKEEQKGFEVLPRRWVVERTLGWFNYRRRLSKDYEINTTHSESMIYLAMISIIVKRY